MPIDLAGLRPSATLLLLRDGAKGLEVLMARRLIQGDHMGGAFIFPGGGLDPADRSPEALAALDGFDAAASSRAMNLPPVEAAALHLAVLREVFEEVGVLVGEAQAGAEELAEARARLARRELDWAGWLEAKSVRFRAQDLAYFAHWITPEGFAKRYATRFFLAALPPGAEVQPDEGEVGEARWVTPAEGLAAAASGDMPMVFPTRHALRSLLPHGSVAEALAAAKDQGRVPDFLPRSLQQGEAVVMVLPGEPGYEGAAPSGLRFDPLKVEGLGW